MSSELNPQPRSFVDKYLSADIVADLQGKRTIGGYSFEQAIRSNIENPDSSIGIYAGDTESYSLFAPLLDPIICDYHHCSLPVSHHSDWTLADIVACDFDQRVKSTRIRIARNLNALPFPPGISYEQRLEVRSRVLSALEFLPDQIKGEYTAIEGLDEQRYQQLVDAHLLFKQGDRFLRSAGVNRDWPSGRGLYLSKDKQFMLWLNEEDHCRIIALQSGGDILAVMTKLKQGLDTLEQGLDFAYSDALGYLTSCPSNLGTTMRASVHVDLSHIEQRPDFKSLCSELNLSVRGVHGEHSDSEAGVYDISNTARLGMSEVEIVNTLYRGIEALLSY